MLKYMDRATIHYLKQKGWSNVQIAEFTGHHRDTIAKVLKEEIDQKPKKRDRKSALAVFDAQIQEWLDQDLPIVRMFELARGDQEHPYTGSETAFYDYVRKTRRRAGQPNPHDVAIRVRVHARGIFTSRLGRSTSHGHRQCRNNTDPLLFLRSPQVFTLHVRAF